MAAVILTPTCEVTGLPLPIRPEGPREREAFFFKNYNYHHHFHPADSPRLKGTDGKALRFSRGQYLPVAMHKRYHEVFAGPELPDDPQEVFKSVVLACSGVIPRQAIDPYSAEIIDLTEQQYEHLSDPKVTYVEGAYNRQSIKNSRKPRAHLGSYFASYAVGQNLSGIVSEKVIKEFIYKKTDLERKKELGNFILRAAVNESLHDIVPLHRNLQNEGYVAPVAKKKRLGQIIIGNFFTKQYFPRYYSEILGQLRASY